MEKSDYPNIEEKPFINGLLHFANYFGILLTAILIPWFFFQAPIDVKALNIFVGFLCILELGVLITHEFAYIAVEKSHERVLAAEENLYQANLNMVNAWKEYKEEYYANEKNGDELFRQIEEALQKVDLNEEEKQEYLYIKDRMTRAKNEAQTFFNEWLSKYQNSLKPFNLDKEITA